MTDHDVANPSAPLRAILESRERFLGFLERRLGRREVAEEVLQAAYLKAIEASASIHDEESTVAWFYRLLRNALVDRRRRGAIEARAVERHGRELNLEVDPEEALQGAICQCIQGVIPTLKREYAEILQRVDLDGTSPQDVARQTGLTPNNVAVRLHRARAALRKELERTCGVCAEHACLDCGCNAAPPGRAGPRRDEKT